tara:strand:+ start:551 stop:871 length:321 start_codon:yes stop_codon:yes gene_type:complete
MLDIGWQEFLLVAFVMLIVVGPKDLPKVLKTIMNFARKIKSMAYDFQNSVDEIANENEIADLKKDVRSIRESDFLSEAKRDVKDLNKIKEETKTSLEKNVKEMNKK